MLEILFENEEIRIINKPYGLASQGGEGIKNSVDTLLEQETEKKCYLVHRLDKETAGILVTAKDPKSAAKWTHLIGTKKVSKIYHAFVFGVPKEKSGTIHQIIEEKGCKKDAVTKFRVLKVFNDYPARSQTECPISLLELTLETGRMHQIRKHLAMNSCPIINDDKHGDFKKNKAFQKSTATSEVGSIKKMMLTAKKLILPQETKIAQIEIPYSQHFQDLLEYFSLKC